MLLQRNSFEMTTLCVDNDEAVRKVNDNFNEIVSRIFNENPELEKHVHITPAGFRFTERNVGDKVIPLRRLLWHIEGTNGGAEKFIERYKEADKNPCQFFIVRPALTLGQLSYLMNISD